MAQKCFISAVQVYVFFLAFSHTSPEWPAHSNRRLRPSHLVGVGSRLFPVASPLSDIALHFETGKLRRRRGSLIAHVREDVAPVSDRCDLKGHATRIAGWPAIRRLSAPPLLSPNDSTNYLVARSVSASPARVFFRQERSVIASGRAASECPEVTIARSTSPPPSAREGGLPA